MNRQEEINVLQSLKEDTYFAQVFKPDTIDAMCRNIENDFPLDCGVDLFENCQSVIRARNEVKTLRGQLDESVGEVEDLREQKSEMVDFLLEQANQISDSKVRANILDKVQYMVGQKATIKRKVQLGHDLTKEDKEWLAQNL